MVRASAKAVVHIRAQGVQGHPALAIPFAAGHFGAAQAAAAVDLDALGAELEGQADGLFHGPAEGDAADELLGHVLGYELGVDFGLADFLDIDEHLALDPAARAGGAGFRSPRPSCR